MTFLPLSALHEPMALLRAVQKADSDLIPMDPGKRLVREANRKSLFEAIVIRWSKESSFPPSVYPYTEDHTIFVWSLHCDGEKDNAKGDGTS